MEIDKIAGEENRMSIAVAVPGAPRGSYREMWLITLGHSLTHWYPATFYLILPIIGKELGLSYSQIGLIMTCQYIAGAVANIPGGVLVDTVGRKGVLMATSLFWGLPLSSYRFHAQLPDAARLRRARRFRQQPVASDCDSHARPPFPREEGPGALAARHGRERRRRHRAHRRRGAARRAHLARSGGPQRRSGNRDRAPPLRLSRHAQARRRQARGGARPRCAVLARLFQRPARAVPQPGAHPPFDELRVPLDDAERAAHFPARVSRLRDGLFALLGGRVHVRAADRGLRRRARRRAPLGPHGPQERDDDQHGDDRGGPRLYGVCW